VVWPVSDSPFPTYVARQAYKDRESAAFPGRLCSGNSELPPASNFDSYKDAVIQLSSQEDRHCLRVLLRKKHFSNYS
jgi:hypothetical protein